MRAAPTCNQTMCLVSACLAYAFLGFLTLSESGQHVTALFCIVERHGDRRSRGVEELRVIRLVGTLSFGLYRMEVIRNSPASRLCRRTVAHVLTLHCIDAMRTLRHDHRNHSSIAVSWR
ncbi:hypothetical protein F5Y18DRAFT_398313 [Xylariaceae sp. FL1019]|nr:hypothetical protein F5Y18DRAFT_398313 [Xylariaceae sp. FL1019]